MVSLSASRTAKPVQNYNNTKPQASGISTGFIKQSRQLLKKHNKKLITLFVVSTAAFAAIKPQSFADLWLTPDQQGQLLFTLKKYPEAANHFTDGRWQAYSQYGAENFKQAATLYGQFDDIDDMLSMANALSQDRRYVNAKKIYQMILTQEPQNKTALNNLNIIQHIIDEVNSYSENQNPESGDSPEELGDKPQTGDGADKKDIVQQKVEQLTAEQLLLDPEVNQMWLRQVQKNPARFLSQKFYMQEEKQAEAKRNASKNTHGDTNE